MPNKKILSDVTGKKSQAWVKKENKKTELKIYTDPFFKSFYHDTYAALVKSSGVFNVEFEGDDLCRVFVRTAKNPRGVLQETSFSDYRAGKLRWHTVFDVDRLVLNEKKDWTFKGLVEDEFNGKTYTLVQLTLGAGDKTTIREFDCKKGRFVPGGFYIPHAHSDVCWLSKNTLLVATDFGKGSLTVAGEAASVRLLKREQPLYLAAPLFTISHAHVKVSIEEHVLASADESCIFFKDQIDFYHAEYHLYDSDNQSLHLLPIPLDAEIVSSFNNTLLIQLASDWKISQSLSFKSNSIISIDLQRFVKDPDVGIHNLNPMLCFQAHQTASIRSVHSNNTHIYVGVLNNLNHQLFEVTEKRGVFYHSLLPLPANGHLNLVSCSDQLIVHYENYLTPIRQFLYDPADKSCELIRSNSHQFNASKYQVLRMDATSKDGTKVPYFMVAAKNINLDGKNPTILTGYGGFGDVVEQTYLGSVGKNLLDKGFVYVEACIRGGGEFGPDWCRAGIAVNKQNSFDDFIAVANDLISENITAPKYLGIHGGSNGGLLVAACAVQQPQLFSAVLSEIPVIDMLEFHRLSIGATWLAEYGDPDQSRFRDIIKRYSPVHNIQKKRDYPVFFLQTSTTDERVHPYHARVMALTLQQAGHSCYFYEDPNGGHTAGVDLKMRAINDARNHAFLSRYLLEPALIARSHLQASQSSQGAFSAANRTKRTRSTDDLLQLKEERTQPAPS